ncbi:MAG: hypothetical protein KME31_22245 [Tolypothrix carrinoi HA7290-LM1]|nr:hypothetical protein [Tolypothrix carrinoi HA7290-LM1]
MTPDASSRRSRMPGASSRETRPRHWLPNALAPPCPIPHAPCPMPHYPLTTNH